MDFKVSDLKVSRLQVCACIKAKIHRSRSASPKGSRSRSRSRSRHNGEKSEEKARCATERKIPELKWPSPDECDDVLDNCPVGASDIQYKTHDINDWIDGVVVQSNSDDGCMVAVKPIDEKQHGSHITKLFIGWPRDFHRLRLTHHVPTNSTNATWPS